MTSPVEICNRALTKLGDRPILTLSDDNERARACARLYEVSRDAVLRDHPWNFAVQRAELAALEEKPVWGFKSQFELPTDCLRVLWVDGNYPWRIEGRRVLSNLEGALRISYIRRVEDPNVFDSLFVEALAARLALELAESLTQSNSKRQAAGEGYQLALIRARSIDAQENPAEEAECDPWIRARF